MYTSIDAYSFHTKVCVHVCNKNLQQQITKDAHTNSYMY